ncbi:MAG: hydantoinase B/oxoprolinase family protein [Pirellulales bacterium]
MAQPRWEFWIDVGGTFTDCIAKAPDGSLRRHKLLSSGATKGRVAVGPTLDAIVDPSRNSDPPRFWIGWQLHLLGADGASIDSAEVVDFDSATGRLRLRGLKKAPAEDAAYELRSTLEAPAIAIRYLLGLSLSEPVPPVGLRLGTTRGTNALITRTGARTALVTTRGFRDVLEIGYQARPRIFDLTVRKPPPLAAIAIEMDERVTHDGHVLVAPQEALLRQQFEALRDAGIESLAICLLHADRHPAHEQLAERIAREVGFTQISRSSAVAPLPKLVARADTTVVDAYLTPVLRDYIERLRFSLPGSQIRLLTSAGGLVPGERFFGKDSILSGPAGGVVGFSRVARACGFERAIGFDMGGTSTDVSRYDGRFELEYETQKAGVRLVAPTLAIETIAAGGGSICRFDGVKLVVGPESAGADPGPACYGRGGPLTITDVNFYLGRIVAERFPFPLDRRATDQGLDGLATSVASSSGVQYSREELAAGLLQIANANMAAAIRLVTVAKGANPADYVLVSFGGAAPQHACAVARELGIRRVLNHPDAGVLSALGIGLADVTRHRSCGVERPCDDTALSYVRSQLDELEHEAAAEIRDEGVAAAQITATRSLDLRYRGVDACLTIAWPADGDFNSAFTDEHRRRYGYVHEGRPLEIAAARVEVVGRVADGLQAHVGESLRDSRPRHRVTRRPLYVDGQQLEARVLDRAALRPDDRIFGPAIITEPISTTVIDPGWEAVVLRGGELLLTDIEQGAGSREPGERNLRAPSCMLPAASPDPVFLEVFNNLMASTADQMGVTLRNTAGSVNVKERLDFSCAIFAADGRLVANAAHLPVHLGAMEETVRQVIAANPDLRPGDVIATNDPYAGGSHLPDITVVTPVFASGPPSPGPSPQGGGEKTIRGAVPQGGGETESGDLLFFTANRAHHAEIGGMAPGSMPPLSKTLADEGVLIRNLKIVDGGRSRFDDLRRLLLTGPYPTRDVESNLADVAAQVAANRQGVNDLLALVERYTWPVVRAYMDHVQTAAEQKVRRALDQLPNREFTFVDHIETARGVSVPIAVRLTLRGVQSTPAATFDFSGTGPVIDGNLNANRAIVTAAVMYVLRLLIDEDIPLNHGVLSPIEIILPPCLLNPPRGATPETTPAMAGGNVETSQRVVDVLLGALGLAAASQGTMNNFIFGDASFGYYETICGGSGATADGAGASAVQVHMTNTRLTDPEVLERRYPVRLQQFSVRQGSGGAGRHRGGDGTLRRVEFLRPVEVSLLSQRRGPHPPYGMAGGQPGALGRNTLFRTNGQVHELAGLAQFNVSPGDLLVIETPGGGGFGPPGN